MVCQPPSLRSWPPSLAPSSTRDELGPLRRRGDVCQQSGCLNAHLPTLFLSASSGHCHCAASRDVVQWTGRRVGKNVDRPSQFSDVALSEAQALSGYPSVVCKSHPGPALFSFFPVLHDRPKLNIFCARYCARQYLAGICAISGGHVQRAVEQDEQ